MNANRRLQGRKQPERIMLCKLGGQESSSVLNFSEDGLGFESFTPIEETDLLHLRLSVDVNSPIEATGRLAWIDSAKRRGGLRFLELSAPAREQIRAWLNENSTAVEETVARFCRGVVKEADDGAAPVQPARDNPGTGQPVTWQETRVPNTQLVPIERHQAQKHRHFLLGVLIGFGIGTVAMISIFRYAGGAKPGSLARTTASANHAAQSSAQQTQAPVVQHASPGAPISKSAAMQTASVAAPTGSPQNERQTQSRKQSPQLGGASSTNLATRTSPPSPRNDDDTAQAPSTKAEPLGASEAAVAPAPVVSNANSSPGQVEGPVEGKVQHRKKVSLTPEQLWAALQKGNMKAAVALADLYARGEGVPQNCQQARVLLQIASAKKNAEASRKLQELDQGGCPQTPTASEPQP